MCEIGVATQVVECTGARGYRGRTAVHRPLRATDGELAHAQAARTGLRRSHTQRVHRRRSER